VFKVIWRKTTSLPQTDGSIVFARWRQCTHMGEHIGATWRIRLNLCFLQHAGVHSPNGKSIGSAISAHLTAESPYTLQWATLSRKRDPSRVGIGIPSISWFLEPDRAHNPNCITIGSAFSHRWPQSVPILYNGMPLYPLKIALRMGGIWTMVPWAHQSPQPIWHLYHLSRFSRAH